MAARSGRASAWFTTGERAAVMVTTGAAVCFQRLWAAVATACPKTTFALVVWQRRP
jgi:hypothetical protein